MMERAPHVKVSWRKIFKRYLLIRGFTCISTGTLSFSATLSTASSRNVRLVVRLYIFVENSYFNRLLYKRQGLCDLSPVRYQNITLH